jgi:Immunity protein 74
MILEVTRSHIKAKLGERCISVPGEMFFPPGDKMGFALTATDIRCWDAPHEQLPLTEAERQAVIDDIRREFEQGGHTLIAA